jgi:hypothetical protein
MVLRNDFCSLYGVIHGWMDECVYVCIMLYIFYCLCAKEENKGKEQQQARHSCFTVLLFCFCSFIFSLL